MTAHRWIRLTGQSLKSHSPEILSGVAVGGVIATAILAARAAVKVHKATEGLEQTPIEIAQNNWKEYVPAGLAGAATIACIIGANQIGLRRNAALLGAYSLVDTAFREYKDEVLEQLGASKEQKVTDEVMRRRMDENPVGDTQVIITGGGDALCYDSITGRYFRSDVEKIRRAENEINHRILNDMYAAHNEFYALVGLDGVTIGDELGWNIENRIELIFSSHLASDGSPCLAIGYKRLPLKDYTKF